MKSFERCPQLEPTPTDIGNTLLYEHTGVRYELPAGFFNPQAFHQDLP